MTATIAENTIAENETAGQKWGLNLRARMSAAQNEATVRNLRLGVGLIGTLLPVMLIAGNFITGDKTIIPSSMSSSYYTSTRNLFIGSLCALGVFLIGYRGGSRLQDLCTSMAGVCALLVAFFPTAPSPSLTPPQTEPVWISYLHLSAAAVLILTLGLFCIFAFSQADGISPRSKRLYLACGVLVLVSELGAVSTVIWPTSWQSLYLFEAVAVFAFGTGWLAEPVQMFWARNAENLTARGSRLPDQPSAGGVAEADAGSRIPRGGHAVGPRSGGMGRDAAAIGGGPTIAGLIGAYQEVAEKRPADYLPPPQVRYSPGYSR